jgi:hypothetical protein
MPLSHQHVYSTDVGRQIANTTRPEVPDWSAVDDRLSQYHNGVSVSNRAWLTIPSRVVCPKSRIHGGRTDFGVSLCP